VWKPALKESGLDSNLRFQDLRPTCASLLIEQGAHPKEIQARLGHSSITTTLDRYGHLMPSLGHQLAVNLDEMRKRVRSDVDVKSHHPCPRSASVGLSHILAFRGLPLG
jgi:integrase